MSKITVPANIDELEHVMDFINHELELNHCVTKIKLQIIIAVEEIFVNIAHYAYIQEEGEAEIECSFQDDPKSVTIRFVDRGIPYNPLKKADPNITLSAEDRKIGGLGTYMVKRSMDEVSYQYRDNKNMLTIKKLNIGQYA